MQVVWANSRFSRKIFARTANTLDPTIQLVPLFAKMTSRSQLLRFLVGTVAGGTPRLPGKKRQGLHRTFGLEMKWRYLITEIVLTPNHTKILLPPKVHRWQDTQAYMD